MPNSTYTPGFADELGNRRVAHGQPGEPLVDVLEFTPTLAGTPGFERALRARVIALRDVSLFSVATVHDVERPDGLGLCLTTDHVPGRRLAELPATSLGSALAVDLIRTVTPVLEVLNQTGVGVAHGALSPGRIVVRDDGALIVAEHVLGWALESLSYSRAQLNALGLAAPAGAPVRFDGRIDMIQLGFLALSVWLRRRLDPADFPDKVAELLNEAAAHEDSPDLAVRLRVWLERALQIGPTPFASAHDAMDALDDLPNDSNVIDTEAEGGLLAFHSEPPSASKAAAATTGDAEGFDVAHMRAVIEQRQSAAEPISATVPRMTRQVTWILAVLAVIAVAEAVTLGLLAFRQRTASTTAAAIERVETPFTDSQPPLPAAPPGALNNAAAPPGVTQPEPSKTSVAPAPGSRLVSGRFGGLSITSALDFLVSADGTPIGPRGAPIALQEGSHRLEFVNDAVGFRHTQTVDVRYGQMTVVRVPMPTGRISVNASPWAEVTIDGQAVGETPIANYSLRVGTHEIVFRHPEMGERRQTVVVKVGEYVRVTQTFDRSPGPGAK